MTIEQIKQRQEQINKTLCQLLERQKTLIQYLLGAQKVDDIVADGKEQSQDGLMVGIYLEQNDTEYLISMLIRGLQTLEETVYAPTVIQEN